MSSPQQTEGGSSTPALVAWFTQVSEAITSAFLGRGSGDSADRSTISPGLPDDGCMTGSDSAPEKPPLGDPDVSSMGNQEKLDAIRKRLAYLGLTDEEIAERLSTIPEETEDLESQMPDLEDNRASSLHCSANSYGEEEDQSSSSDSEDEIAKFEIFQSHSHNLCSSGVARHHRLSCLLSDCTDGDGLSSYQDPLTFGDQDGESMSSQDTMNGSDPCLHKGPENPERSVGPVLCGPAPKGNVETEMAQDNEDATDSSSTWSPENQAAGEELAGAEPSPSIYHPVTSCGDLVVVLDYRAEQQKLLVTVARARDVPDKERSGMEAWQVHLVLLPAKKQRHKTGVGRGPAPHFGDTFRFLQLDPDELGVSALRFRLYAVGKMSREHMMGEGLHHLRGLVGEGETEATVELKPRSYMQSESVSSTQLLSHGGVPELLLGLSYNATTGRLSVEVIKGSHFRNLAISRPPDTYGKLTLLDSTGQEVSRCKTSVRRGQPNPVYKETFVFQVALFQLADVTLLVSIYSRRSMKRKEMVGWVSLGQSSSGQEEQLHWQDMRESHGQQVCRWHSLLES